MNRIIGVTILAITIGSCAAETTGNENKLSEKIESVEIKQEIIIEDLENKIQDTVEIKLAAEEEGVVVSSVNKNVDSSIYSVKPFMPIDSSMLLDVESVDSVVVSSLEVAQEPMVITFNHLKFNELLQKHVSENGVVNYDSFKKETHKLDEYLKMLASTTPKSTWSRNKQLAYYINLYNASTVSLILKNYPLKSILDITKAWDISFIKVGENTFSLNDVENKIIRPTFKEPRIHFAVNCAALSCPKLSNKAFSEKNINTLLQENTERFLKNTEIGLKQNGNAVELSQIFEWYAVDFGGKENLLKWITANSKLDLSKASFKSFIAYNWELNNK